MTILVCANTGAIIVVNVWVNTALIRCIDININFAILDVIFVVNDSVNTALIGCTDILISIFYFVLIMVL